MRFMGCVVVAVMAASALAACGSDDESSATTKPVTTESAAGTTEPAADTTEPAADTTEAASDTTESAADTTEPAPETTEPAAEPEGVFRVMLSSATGFNVQRDPLMLATSGLTVAQSVFDPLVFEGENEALSADGLATSWEVDEAAGSVTLKLREGVTFTDGTAFDAEAVKANMERGIALAAGPYFAAFFAKLASVDVVDPYTVKLNFSAMPPDVLLQLARPPGWMISPASFDLPNFSEDPIGSGPYVLDLGASDAQKLVLTLNPNYWHPAWQKVKEVDFLVVGTADAAIQAVASGDADMYPFIQTADELTLAKSLGLTIVDVPPRTPWGMQIDDHSGKVVPELGDPDVRQAMALAVDGAGFNAGPLGGFNNVSNQWAPEGNPFRYDDLQEIFSYDQAEAMRLLNGRKFTCTSPEGVGTGQQPFAEFVKSELAKVGITVELEAMDGALYRTERFSGKYTCPIMTFSWQDPATNYNTFFRAPGVVSAYGPMPDDIEALATQGEKTLDLTKRQTIYHDLYDKLFNGHYLNLFYQSGLVVGLTDGVSGITPKGQIGSTYDPRGVSVSAG